MSDDRPPPALPIRMLDTWAGLWLGAARIVGELALLLVETSKWMFWTIFLRRARFGLRGAIAQLIRVGVRSIGIVMLVSGAIGVILALQTEPSLAQFGQTDKVANLIGVAVFRELGPLIAAIVLVGYAGASIAAELGTMVVGEEIEALEAMALNPVRVLVMPRVVATTIALILLAVISNLSAVIMGGVMGVFGLGIPYEIYKNNTITQVTNTDFFTGLVKAGVFGLIIGLIACNNGLRVSGGAAGVGRATTDTVVQSVVTVVIADLMFTAIFYAVGWT
ncbi:MAG: ABC transporter permease [Phycisphaeraceae bacterium]|nr:ABC transporter permease [Phycisphaeraceae bacterium]